MRRLLLAGMLLALLPGASSAVTLMVNGDTPSVRWQAAIDRARVPLPPGVIDLYIAACPFTYAEGIADGCASTSTNPPSIYLTPADLLSMRRTLRHEVGHVFDAALMTPGARARFARIWHRPPDVRWCDDAESYDPTAPLGGTGGVASRTCEWFADAYSACADAGDADYWRMTLYTDRLVYIPNALDDNSVAGMQLRRRLVASCRLVRSVAAR